MGEVIPRINDIAAEINAKVLGQEPAARPLPPAKSAEEKPREKTPSIYAHPERLLQEGALVEGGNQASSSPFIASGPTGETAEFWRSGSFDVQIQGLALGDVDGDGATETIIISTQKIIVFRIQQRRLIKLKEFTGQTQQRFIWVDAADIKQDGRAEIFVSCINSNNGNLDSFVLEWNGADFETIASGQKWYFRVQELPWRGRVLLGQKRSAEDLFFPGIYELAWQNGTYESAGRLSLPKGKMVYEFALGDVMNTGNEMVVSLGSDDRLRIQTVAGKNEWKSDERYGGSENFLLKYPGTSSTQRIFLPQRIFVADLNRNGKIEVTVVKHDSITGYTFNNYRKFSSAQFVSLSWDGFGLSEIWHTRKISGYFGDYAIGDVDNDGQPELVAAVVSRREGLLAKAKSSLIAYELHSLVADGSKANAPEPETQ
jgi:hypothetical protein